MNAVEYHHLSVGRAVGELDTHLEQGLSYTEAQSRLDRYGLNELTERPRPSFLKMLFEQFDNLLVIILIAAAVISLFMGEVVDALAIIAFVALNAVIGVIQEAKAEQSLASLRKMTALTAEVIREGHQVTIPARELAPGDIVTLEAGNYVSADLRLVESINLKIEEAALTGESTPVDKNARVVLDKDLPIGDRRNSAFMGTLVTYGRGKGLVTATGMHTQMGMIAEMIQSHEEELTPLQQKLDQLGRWLGLVSLAICSIIFVFGVVRDTEPTMAIRQGLAAYLAAHEQDIIGLLMTAVSLAIAAAPEGLPAVVTICLALGMQRMVSRHTLIRKLPAVETLGCATVICSDKTGTLTQNEMTVVRGWAGGKLFEVTGNGYYPDGQFVCDGQPLDLVQEPSLMFLLHGALLCNDARLEESGYVAGEMTYRMVGDPTEGAMVVAAAKAHLWRKGVEKTLPRVTEIPFDSERKRMTTIHRVVDGRMPHPNLARSPFVAFVKGAPDVVLQYCDCIMVDGQAQPLTEEKRKAVLDANQEMARQALRVLGVAFRPITQAPESPMPRDVEVNLTFLGLLGMIDPARPEVKMAMRIARKAGLKSVMVTGDYKDTAEAIAREVGLLSLGGRVLTGAELDQMSEAQLVEIVEQVDAYARVSPAHKMKIVDALKDRGHVVAMTGDGVNDAPALKRADIGIAMGITGTDVSKETADMVLTDDNYASIVSAIEEGRIIYSNIRKSVFYLISCNIGEILIIFLSMLAGLPIPLRPIQLLWLNLVTDGAPALALGLEKGDPDIMERPPRPPLEPVINQEMLIGIIVQAIVMTSAVLAAFLYGLRRFPENLAGAQTVAFATLIMSELLRAFTARSERYPLFRIGVLSNRWMLWAVCSSFALLLLVMYVPFLQPVFGTVSLNPGDWLVMLPLFLAASVAAEVTKVFLRWRAGRA